MGGRAVATECCRFGDAPAAALAKMQAKLAASILAAMDPAAAAATRAAMVTAASQAASTPQPADEGQQLQPADEGQHFHLANEGQGPHPADEGQHAQDRQLTDVKQNWQTEGTNRRSYTPTNSPRLETDGDQRLIWKISH